MTTVAAFQDHHGNVAIAADRAFTNTRVAYHRKLYSVGDMAVAGNGLDILTQIISDLAKSAEPPKTARELAGQIFDDYLKFGQERAGELDKSINAALIIIRPGEEPWMCSGSESVMQYDDNYCATGTGVKVALGVLYAARKNRWTASTAVEMAVRAAVHHDVWSGGEVDVVVFEGPKVATP